MGNKFFLPIIAVSVIILSVILLIFINYSPGRGSVCLNKFCFEVEVAETQIELSRGLMFRKNLDQNKGMLFVFEKEGNYPFWMKNTLIPLDIIWIDKDSKVVFISENNLPCLPAQAGKDSACPLISPNRSAKYVLEINSGILKKIGLKAGDSVVIK